MNLQLVSRFGYWEGYFCEHLCVYLCTHMHFSWYITRCGIEISIDLRWQLFSIGISPSSRFHLSVEKSAVLVLSGKTDLKQRS